jgi:hypothetical protein
MYYLWKRYAPPLTYCTSYVSTDKVKYSSAAKRERFLSQKAEAKMEASLKKRIKYHISVVSDD